MTRKATRKKAAKASGGALGARLRSLRLCAEPAPGQKELRQREADRLGGLVEKSHWHLENGTSTLGESRRKLLARLYGVSEAYLRDGGTAPALADVRRAVLRARERYELECLREVLADEDADPYAVVEALLPRLSDPAAQRLRSLRDFVSAVDRFLAGFLEKMGDQPDFAREASQVARLLQCLRDQADRALKANLSECRRALLTASSSSASEPAPGRAHQEEGGAQL